MLQAEETLETQRRSGGERVRATLFASLDDLDNMPTSPNRGQPRDILAEALARSMHVSANAHARNNFLEREDEAERVKGSLEKDGMADQLPHARESNLKPELVDYDQGTGRARR